MADYTVEQLKDAARRAFEDNNIAVTKKLIARAKALEASQAKAAQPENVTAIEDISKAGAGGFTRGAAETADMAKSIIDAPTRLGISALRALGIGTDQSAEAAQRALDTPEGKSARELASKLTGGLTEYDPQTLLGEYAGTTGEFVGGAAALPIGGPLRSIGSAVVPALASETAGQIARAKAPELEGTARLLAALGVPAAQAAATPALRRMAIGDPRQVSGYSQGSPRAAQVRALEEAGVQDLTAGQKIGSEQLMRLEGRLEPTVRQKDELTLAATRMAGIDGLATPENLSQARSRITRVFDEFDDLIDQPATMREADEAAFLLSNTEGAGANYTAPKDIRDVVTAIEDSAFDNSPIIGAEFRRLRQKLRNVRQKNLGQDALSVSLADDLIGLLQKMATRQVSQTAPDLLPALQTANKQYRALTTIEKAITRGGSEAASGRITPSALSTSARTREGVSMTRGTGSEMAELGLAAQGVMTPLPTVGAGAVRYGQRGPLGTILEALPRAVARYSQDTLARPANQVMTERLLQRLARQSGGLLNIED